MANQIIPKKSVVAGKVPTTGDLGLGEVSINHADRIIFARHPQSGTVQQLGAAPVHTHVLTDITDLGDLVLDADWADIKNKPGTFPPDSHTHPLSDLTQSSATTGQVPTWSGNAWVPQAPPTGTNADWSATTGASQILNKPTLGTAAATSATDYATATHTHTLADITQSSATTGQVATWSGSAWVPQTPAAGGVTSVAGRTGAVTLTTADISGLSSYVKSDTTGVSNSTQISNMTQITQAGYNAITPNANTLYVIVG
jgi:hypothetical protein